MSLTRLQKWHQRRYQGRLNSGLCPTCGGKRDSGWILCSACRLKGREAKKRSGRNQTADQRRYRNKCRKYGICYGCGSALRDDPHKRCLSCRIKDRERVARYHVRKALEEVSVL